MNQLEVEHMTNNDREEAHRVLVIDDDDLMNPLIQEVLLKEGFKADGVYKGADALTRVLEAPYAVLLVDFMLPDMTGKELVESLKEKDCLVPFISITGHGNEKLAVAMMKLGARDYLIKEEGFLRLLPEVVKRVFKELAHEKKLVEAEEALHLSEERYRRLFEESNDAIFLHSLDGAILNANRQACKMLDYSHDELLTMSIFTFHPEEILPSCQKAIQVTRRKGSARFESKFRTKKGKVMDVEISSSIVETERGLVQCIVREITERKRTEMEMKRRLMKFRLDEGELYLAKEPKPSQSLEAFKELLMVGYQGVVISRTTEKDFRRFLGGDFAFIWLAEKGGQNTLSPDIVKIEERIENMPRKQVILMERLDYLIFKMGSKKTLELVQHLKELCYLKNSIAILSLDPAALQREALRLFEKESKKIEPLHKTPLSRDLFELLKHIYQQNLIGVKPSYGAVHVKMGMSKPTVRTKLKRLITAGYVKEETRGSSKIVELTELGMSLIVK